MTARDALRALAAHCRGSVSAGAEWRGEVRDGDLVAEVVVRVRPHVTHDAASAYHKAAMEALRKDPLRVRHCGCSVMKRSSWGGSRPGDCAGRIVAAVVHRSYGAKEDAYRFVCGRHRENHGIRPEIVLAVVELREPLLARVRAHDKENAAAWSARCRVEEEERHHAPVSHVIAYYEVAARAPCEA